MMQRNQSAHTAWEQPVTQEFTIKNDSTIFTLQSKSTSEKNFAVHLVQQFFSLFQTGRVECHKSWEQTSTSQRKNA